MKLFSICSSTECVPRDLDAIKVRNYFISNGLTFTNDFRKADLIIINTCANIKENVKDKVILK